MEQQTVKEIVAEDFRTAAVFERYSIDFCCHGNVPLDEACKGRGVTVDQVLSEIGALTKESGRERESFDTWDLDRLADYIVTTHHAYVKSAIPALLAHTDKVAMVHGERHPELLTIRDIFGKVAGDLSQHMMKEELMLFPYIKAMARARRDGSAIQRPPFGTIQNPLRMMEREHESAGNETSEIRSLSNVYTPPTDACTTYRVTLQELNAFEMDLHKHVHLENNILFPKAIVLEQELFHI